MATFAEALRRDIDRIRFAMEAEKVAVRKPKKPKAKEDAERTMSLKNIRLLIRDAAVKRHQIIIRYSKITTDETKNYRVAPYSYRYRSLRIGTRKMLFAYDMVEKRIKGFVAGNIMKVTPTEKRFSPKWPIEIGSWLIAAGLTLWG